MYSGSAFGINTKHENIVRRWAVKNGHEETAQPEADKVFYDSYSNAKDLYNVPNDLIDKYTPISKSWLYLHDGYEVSFNELIDLFNQANSRNAEVSRLALQLIYKLRGDKYLDIQRIVAKCGFTELKFCTEHDTYRSIMSTVYSPIETTEFTLANLPLTALCSIQRSGTQCPEITVPFLNWILKEFSMFNNPKIKFEANVSYD
jgi:hypothetical protein